MRSWPKIGRALPIAIALVALLSPNGAGAATVVNGDFESGSLSGWTVYDANPFGDWFAYKGTETPIGASRKKQGQGRDVQPPPQGAYAAVTDEVEPDTLILYQDVALGPGRDYQLSLVAYYDSYKPIAIPTPDTLSITDEALQLPNGKFQENQQFRIDVMKPEAPLESLDPADILRTVFATRLGDPPTMGPRRLTANLSAFAGQTVRLRIANTVTAEVFNAGVDAISIAGAAPGQLSSGHGPKGFRVGKAKVNRRTGIATLRVSVVGSGLLRASRAASAAPSRPGMRRLVPIEPVTVAVAAAKTVTIRLRPTPKARAVLRRKHEARARVAITYLPTGGGAEAVSVPIVFALAGRHHPRR